MQQKHLIKTKKEIPTSLSDLIILIKGVFGVVFGSVVELCHLLILIPIRIVLPGLRFMMLSKYS